MKKELKEKWVAALRSGQYEQARGKLRDGDGYCCIAVLCELTEVQHDGESFIEWNGNLTISDADDPLEWTHGAYQNKLVKMNDDLGKTFPEIADWIEANIPGE
jgi:hypothetical protein